MISHDILKGEIKMPNIVTQYYVPKTNEESPHVPAHTCSYHSQPTISAVIVQLNAVLDTIHDEHGISARESAEWISQDNDDLVEFPLGETFSAMRHGSNEGYLVHLFALNRDTGIITCVLTIKYLSDKDFSYRVAKTVNEALYDGAFECRTPPDYIKSETNA